MSSSKDFIFRSVKGELTFIGDFEGLYQSTRDPWHQTGTGSRMSEYYQSSRTTLAELLNKLGIKKAVEVGCGIGASTQQLSAKTGTEIIGVDISETAILRARNANPNRSFVLGDIKNPKIVHAEEFKSADAILLNQILWYVMYDLEKVLKNCEQILDRSGFVIISTAFLHNQKYGADLFEGPWEFTDYLGSICAPFSIIHKNQNNEPENGYIDSHVVLSL